MAFKAKLASVMTAAWGVVGRRFSTMALLSAVFGFGMPTAGTIVAPVLFPMAAMPVVGVMAIFAGALFPMMTTVVMVIMIACLWAWIWPLSKRRTYTGQDTKNYN